MKTVLKILFIAVSLALLWASCAKDSVIETGGEYSLRITPRIDVFVPSQGQQVAESRAIVEGTKFANGIEVGYIILGSAGAPQNAGLPHTDGYGHVRALSTSNVNEWLYYIYDAQLLGTSLPGIGSYGNVDIYGYHPYNAAMTDMRAIPYRLGDTTAASGNEVVTTAAMTEIDYMYATPRTNYMMQIGQSANMTFHHIMTCLEFRVNKSFAGPAMTVATIDFTIDGGREFIVAGTYDATTGDIVRGPSANRIFVDYHKTMNSSSSNSSTTASCSLIFPSLDYSEGDADATITAVFHFTDQDGADWKFRDGDNTTYSFKLSDVADGGGNKGLRAGKRYQVIVSISNFVKYSGLPTVVYPDWDTDKVDTNPNMI